MKAVFKTLLAVTVFATSLGIAHALIGLMPVDPDKAKEMGIEMKSRPNGDAGVKVWLEFRPEGPLKGFAYAELRMEDEDGNHLLSARLEEHAVTHGQDPDLVTVAFSAEPSQLSRCTFWVVAYDQPMSGVGYMLKVSDFLDLEEG